MKQISLCILLTLLSISFTFSQDKRATTKEGDPVLLRSNGTWFYFNPVTEQKSTVSDQGTTAILPGGQLVILKKDRTWILTTSYERPVIQNSPAPTPQTQKTSVALLAQKGHWEAKYWETHRAMLEKPALSLELDDWMNETIPQESWGGKIVVVDFWATWCGPCRQAIPHNNELYRRYKSKGVLIVGACASGGHGGQERMGEVVEQLGLEYPTAKVADGSVHEWNVFYFPTYAIIDRKGNLRAMGISPGYVERIIQALLQEL